MASGFPDREAQFILLGFCSNKPIAFELGFIDKYLHFILSGFCSNKCTALGFVDNSLQKLFIRGVYTQSCNL